MRFNINRATTTIYRATLSGTSAPVAVALGQRYYLSDFIEASISDDGGNTIKGRTSVGSYMYYNTNTKNYNIKEIYLNTLSNKQQEAGGYDKILVSGGATGASFVDGNPNSTKANIYYPISKDDEGNYEYNIDYLCGVNKLKFPNSNNFGIIGITVNITNTQYVDIDDSLINNYISENDPTGVSVVNNFINLNPISKDVNITGLYGNKNYNSTIPRSNPYISIIPIYRIKRPAEQDPCGIAYPSKSFTKDGLTQEVEFFKYFDEGTYNRDNSTEFVVSESNNIDYKTNFKNQVNAFIQHKICNSANLNNEEDSAPVVMSNRASEIYIDESE
jgi:hypothetical protein